MGRVDFRSERGVAFTEFALIAPVFLLLVAGLLAFGRVFFYWIETNHVASETARWAVVDRNPYAPGQSLFEQARDRATAEFQSNVRVCIDFPEGGTPTLGSAVRVRVHKPFDFIPFVGVSQVWIRGSSTMRVERFGGSGTAPTAYSAGAPYGSCDT